MKKLFPEVLDASPNKTRCSGNPSCLRPIFHSSGVRVTSNISSSGFSCKQVCATSPLQSIFCLAESREGEGLAQPRSTAVPSADSPPAPPFPRCDGHRAGVGSQVLVRSPPHVRACRCVPFPGRSVAMRTLACCQHAPERE